MFHVCINRNDRIVDQPFICPFPTVFKTGSSGNMYCAHMDHDDCKGKFFYRTTDASIPMEHDLTDANNYLLPKNTLMLEKCSKPGLYPDSLYCNAYHKCTMNGGDEQYLCENQLLFNPESHICDYPINVVCGGKRFLLYE